MVDFTLAPKPVSLTGETWERLRSASYAISEGKKGALIAAATLDEQGKPKADLLLCHKIADRWYIAGGVAYAGGTASAEVLVTATW